MVETRTLKMDPEVKKRWVEALRSGGYRQGKDYLAYIDAAQRRYYCCLGVLCQITGTSAEVVEDPQPIPLTPGVDGEMHYVRFGFADTWEAAMLPKALGEALGIPDEVQEHLATKNDHGASFSEIADWIEENL